jgi:hypothetical protein
MSAKGPKRLEIHAQVSGSLKGLTYRWICDSGQCNPQESDLPTTTYVFSDENNTDNLSVDVYKGTSRVARSEIEVRRPVKPAKTSLPSIPIEIEITQVPPYDPLGGPNTRADISGRVKGPVVPADHKVIIYSRAHNIWYIQPGTHSTHEVKPDNTWSGWTHKGSSYAAFVVARAYIPVFMLDILPTVGGDVLARVVEEGKRSSPTDRDESVPDPVATSGGGAVESVAGTQTPDILPMSTTVIRVKIGAKVPLIDRLGRTWQPDEGFIDGVQADRDVAIAVENTDVPELYHSERYDITRFHCQVPNGRYIVRLYFAEMYAKIKNPGDRVFSIRLEGKAYDDIDVLALAGGPRRAFVDELHTTVLHSGLTVLFSSTKQRSFLNAIEIVPDVKTAP